MKWTATSNGAPFVRTPTSRVMSRTTGAHPASETAFTFAAVAIVAVGALMRLYTIFAFTWDQDELYTRIEARELFHTTLPPGIDARPLYYLIQHPLLSILPQSAPMLRLLPFLFGVAGLWITWLVGRRQLGSVGGLLAVFLAATSTWHMEASGQARYYSLVYLLSALVVLWLPYAIDTDRRAAYIATFVAMSLGTLTHPSFVFPIIGVVAAATLVTKAGQLQWRWPSRNGWLFLWTPFLTFLFGFFAILRHLHRQSALRNSIGRGLVATLRLVPGIVEWITPVVFGAALLGAACLLLSRHVGRRRLATMYLASLVITLGGLFAASFWTATYTTYATALLPIIFVTAGAAAQQVADLVRDRAPASAVATAAIALFGFAVAPSTISHLIDGTRFDYRPAYKQIEREEPNVAVLTWPANLAKEYAPELTLLPLRPDGAYLDSTLSRYHDLWVVSSVKRPGIALDDTGELERWLATRCHRHGVFERPRFDYRIYRVELHRCLDARGAAALR
jgi:Dolichyl-phosphate-mannose-protein mannosyltransferase